MLARAYSILIGLSVVVCGCGARELELEPRAVTQAGGVELRLAGEFAGHGAVVVLIDGVAAHGAVLEGPDDLRVRVPPLPRAGIVDVEVVFADGERMQLREALRVSPPPLDVRPEPDGREAPD